MVKSVILLLFYLANEADGWIGTTHYTVLDGYKHMHKPDDIWRPHAELWCQALSIAVSILEQL